MALIPIADPRARAASRGYPLFELGFRPFFLLAGLAAALLIGGWLWMYGGNIFIAGYYPPVIWHGHEMLFGYTVAVVAGFLLTAVRNWTRHQTPKGGALAALVLLWLLGRMTPFASDWLPGIWIATLDFAFLPVLTVVLALPLWRRSQKRNLVFIVLLTGLALCNAAVHLDLLGLPSPVPARQALITAALLIVLMILVMGGRVIPFFTEKAIAGCHVRGRRLLERAAPAAAVMFVVLQPFAPRPAALAATVAAVLHGLLLAGWFHRDIPRHPLVWVLHLGYGWIVAGLALSALSVTGLVPVSLALHAFTVGGIGMITLGMMARVSLGHTGRELRTGPAIRWAFGLVAAAVVVRVLCGWLLPQWYLAWVLLAGVLWMLAFLLFVMVYFPVLAGPSRG